MKFRLLLFLFIMGAGILLAQKQYPLVTIHDIQYIDSVGTKGFINSPYLNDTVRVRGVVMIRTLVDPATDRTPIMYYGSAWGSYIQDTTSGQYWGGLNIYQTDTTGDNQNTFFDLADTSDYVEITGVVTNYYSTNEFQPLVNPATPINFISRLPRRPAPIQLSVTDFMKNLQVVNEGLKYSGMYVELHGLISANRNSSTGAFNAYDTAGNYVMVYPQSRYYRLDHKLPSSKYQPPADGTSITTLKGIVSPYNSLYEILPIYPEDLIIKGATPPSITIITRSPVKVATNKADTIYAKVVDLSSQVNGVQLHYRIGEQNRIIEDMNQTTADTNIYYAVIPGISQDSTLVDFYITAKNVANLVGYVPSDTVKGNYFYQVNDSPLTIRDVQYSPFGSGYSSYNGYYVTLTGIVTADTSDYPGKSSNYPQRVYMQQGSGPWTGILIGTKGMHGTDVLKFKDGDSITLTGKIVENFYVTTIDSLTSIVINSNNNPVPTPVTVPTADIGKYPSNTISAEQWESVLIDYKNVSVVRENADGNPGPGVSGVNNNYGEMYVKDTLGGDSTRVSLQDGNNNYENHWDSNFIDNPAYKYINTGSKFSELRGIIYFSFSNYKLCPRKADDFVGFIPTAVNGYTNKMPGTFGLNQNYPNPFNPSTVITFSIPKASQVTLKIYDILGQEVKTLVNDSKMPGKYTISFNASSLSSGVYFYALRAGKYFQVKKMMLLK